MPSKTTLNWHSVSNPTRIPLYGRTVLLEPLDDKLHAADLWDSVQCHEELWDYLGDGPYVDENTFRIAIEKKKSAADAVFFAFLAEANGRAEGYASFMRMDGANGVIEVGNILLSPALQRTTAATEAMYLMARHVFDDLGYRRYEWKCNALNEPSRRAALRYGFTYEGIFRQHMVVKDMSRDTAWFSMLDHEWPARKRAFEAWLDPANFDEGGRQRRSLIECGSV